MKFGICASYAEVAALPHISFDYLEENVQRFLQPEQPQSLFEEGRREAQRLSIPIEAANSFLPADLHLIATPTQTVDNARLERYIKTALRRAEQVGIRVIVFGSGGARHCPAGYPLASALAQLEEHLLRWSAWAGEHGVELALEPLRYAEANTINTVAEGGSLVERVSTAGATSIKLLADAYHMASNGEPSQTIESWATLLAHIHVAELAERAAPGTHGEDFRPFFATLQRAHYQQRISIECNWRQFSAQADSAIALLRQQWADAQATSNPSEEAGETHS